jgi:hypothetical protein
MLARTGSLSWFKNFTGNLFDEVQAILRGIYLSLFHRGFVQRYRQGHYFRSRQFYGICLMRLLSFSRQFHGGVCLSQFHGDLFWSISRGICLTGCGQGHYLCSRRFYGEFVKANFTGDLFRPVSRGICWPLSLFKPITRGICLTGYTSHYHCLSQLHGEFVRRGIY